MHIEGDIVFQFACKNVKDINLFSKSDPFVQILKPHVSKAAEKNIEYLEANDWVLALETNHVDNNLNPVFHKQKINCFQLCYNELDMPLKIEIRDYSEDSYHKLISSASLTLNEIINGKRTFETLDDNNEPAGVILVLYFLELPKMSISDLIDWGVNLEFTVGIDFSDSNGDHSKPNSLHYLSDESKNDYQKILESLGKLLFKFDCNKKVQALGFGVMKDDKPQDCFPLSGDEKKFNLESLEEILEAYIQVVKDKVPSSSNSLFPILKRIEKHAQHYLEKDKKKYHILIVLTDGVDGSIVNLKNEVVKMSELPISIVIIGVGSMNNQELYKLDSDDKLLIFSKDVAKRDIVQYVEYKKHHDKSRFIADTLLEMPAQIVQYFRNVGLSLSN